MGANDTRIHMPWNALINAFMRDIPRRRQLQADCMSNNPLFNLREFHVLSYGGSRQCGKTHAALDVVRHNPNARFIKNSGGYIPDAVRQEAVLQERSIEKIGITREQLEGVKVLVIDNDGRAEVELSPYKLLETLYTLHNDWFDPDIVIIRVL